MEFSIAAIQNVYQHLQDEESRQIFNLRWLYSISGDISHIRKIVKVLPEGREFYEIMPGEMDYIFGCGSYGRLVHKYYSSKWKGFVDNNPLLQGKTIEGMPVISPCDLPKDARIFLAIKYHEDEVKKQLLELGIKEENIINIGKILYDMGIRQYFDLEYLPHDEHEVFVDAGSLNGDSSKAFIKWANNNYEHIYCFEPDAHNVRDCGERLKEVLKIGKITLIEKGLWSQCENISFTACHNGNSAIGDGEDTIETTTLDYEIGMMGGTNVSFIKMDIEGAEYNALLGAKDTIQRFHPKLAISVYHLADDIYKIPAIICSYVPNYRFYIRHYSLFDNETILYAFV